MEEMGGLAQLIATLTSESGIYSTDVPGLWLSNFSAIDPPRHTIDCAVFCIVAQGEIRILLPGQVHTHGAGHFLVLALDLPIVAQLTGATPDKPYLGVTLQLNFDELSELSLADERPVVTASGAEMGLFFGEIESSMIDAVYRLVNLLTSPEDIPALAPLVRREIFYRLLCSNQSGLLRKMMLKSSQIRRISHVVDWMKKNYTKTFKIEELARRANMSAPSLHSWFKTVTTLSPLQFQKQLRLQEARRILYREDTSAATVSRRVGYESASHFNRDYSRLFGAPPHRDLERMRSVSGGINGTPRVLSYSQIGKPVSLLAESPHLSKPKRPKR